VGLAPFLCGQEAPPEPAQGLDSPAWARKMAAVGEQPFEMDLVSEMFVPAGILMTRAKGHYTFADEGHFRLEFRMTVFLSRFPDAGEDKELTTRIVADGKNLWQEILEPDGTREVRRMSLVFLAKHSREIRKNEGGLGAGLMMGRLFDGVGEMLERGEFGLPRVSRGKVLLKGRVEEEPPPGSGQAPPGFSEVTVTLDEKTARLLAVETKQGGGTRRTTSFSNYRFRAFPDRALFTYTPPGGIEIQDMEAILIREGVAPR